MINFLTRYLEFLNFVDASPSPYHAVHTSKTLLLKAGFQEISERKPWDSKISAGQKYFLTRNGSSVVAFAIGAKWKPGNGIAIVGAHTDSPTLKVKPKSKSTNVGYTQVGVELYGRGIWSSWFDRDLSVAGRVLVREKSSSKIVPKLIKIDKPILRIPTLAIHLDKELKTTQKFGFNLETQLHPISGLVAGELNKSEEKSEEPKIEEFASIGNISTRHENGFLSHIAHDLGVEVSDIEDFELVLFDTQPACVGGLDDEFIFSPRLDNLNSSFASLMGLFVSLEDSGLDDDESIRMVTLFDHEEIGSQSAQGAGSNLSLAVITRLNALSVDGKASSASCLYESSSKSFLVSADMAHAVHPNYSSIHESEHRPSINKGPVVKINAYQKYATNSPGIVLMQNAANIAKVPLQLFVIRNDSLCGSTIGPILASKLGIRTLDIGNPQLAMHSIREMGGSEDVDYAIKLYGAFFANYTKLENEIIIDGEN